MTDRVIADRYAQALAGMISEMKELDKMDNEIRFICNMLDSDPTFKRFFFSPKVHPEMKKEVFLKTFKGRISKDLLNLFLLLIDKNRERITPELSRSFSKFANQIRGVKSGTVITAVPLTADEFQMLEKAVVRFSRRKITLKREVDPNLLGGVVLRLGDHVFDGSVRYKLETIKRKLLEVKTHIPAEIENEG